MMKLTGRTSHQITALVNEGFVVENITATTCEVHAYDTWAELRVAVANQRGWALKEASHYYATGKFAQQSADLADGSTQDETRVRRSMRRSHLTALASVDRYLTEQEKIEAETPDAKTIEKIVKKRKTAQAKKEQRRQTQGRDCECGCKGTTGGGRYLPGHDAKHKSALVKLAIQGEGSEDVNENRLGMNAYAQLEERGWLKFLDKAKEVAARPKADPRVVRAAKSEDAEARARENIARLELMKEAGRIIRDLGRWSRKDDNPQVIITGDNAKAIVDGTFDYEAHDAEVAS